MKNRVTLALCLAAVGAAVLMSFAARGRVMQGASRAQVSVEDPRPVAKAIETLEARHGWVITYEDPPYAHHGDVVDVTAEVRKDLHKFRPGEAPKVLIPKGGALAFEYDLAAASGHAADPAAVVRQLLDAYARGGGAGAFRLEGGGQVVHVIPAAGRNGAGSVVAHDPVLDAPITLPAEERRGLQTLEAICAAVSQATGAQVIVGTVPVSVFARHRDQHGASGERARDVLLRTLGGVKGGGKLSWQLFYDPGMKTYVLNIHQV